MQIQQQSSTVANTLESAIVSKDSSVFDEQEKQFLSLKAQLRAFEES
jgi:hypothetical protein